ncbi:hypothetical protein [Crocosphaera sp. Alani8]|uniref:hypothetical protein n=1 Tax=Crocosphaera sp. Alani8 TaxID=3038952 RepID=UPI00313D343E
MLSSSDNGLCKNLPIPSPSHPRQYRAIGLIEGQYQRSQEHPTRGILITQEGNIIDTVVLGKVLSVFKKHLDLDKPHLWIVYPRTRPSNDQLQLQIAGVWEPEVLHPENTHPLLSDDNLSPEVPVKSGDFSIRGQVVYASHQKKIAIVKIRQSPKHPSEKPKFFKLKLQGPLADKAVGCFWDLQVRLVNNQLTIVTGKNLGQVAKKRGGFAKKRVTPQLRPKKLLINEEHSLSPPNRISLPKPVNSTRSNFQKPQ